MDKDKCSDAVSPLHRFYQRVYGQVMLANVK